MKDLFKKVHDFAEEVIGGGKEEGVAIIIAAIDTTVEPEEGLENNVIAINGRGSDLLPLLSGLLENEDLQPLFTHAMLANLLKKRDKVTSGNEKDTPANFS